MKILCSLRADDDAPVASIVIQHEIGALMISARELGRLAFTELSCPDLKCATRCWRTRNTALVEVEVDDLRSALRLLRMRQADVLNAFALGEGGPARVV